MRTWFVPVVVVFFVLLSTDTLSATDCYVRTDGSNVVCDGTADAPQSAQPNCAFASVLYAANN
jgi:hypothetical protein